VPERETDVELARQLVAAQESEARRIAGELHARVGQLLTALARTLELACEGDRQALFDAREILADTIQATRELSTELWPSILEELGLAPALRWLAERYATRLGHVVFAQVDEVTTSTAVGTACYRIAEEAFANIARHASARSASVKLRRDGGFVELEIRDDGRGFDPSAVWPFVLRGASLGLLAMRERARLVGGTFTIDSQPTAGTTVTARVPLDGV
jgi:signal transduction histidine kinase